MDKNSQTELVGGVSNGETKFRLAIVILNYRTAKLVIDCLESLAGQIDPESDRIVIVDNASNDDSVSVIDAYIQSQDLAHSIHLITASNNGGFSAGNNFGIQLVQAELYLLLNSDTLVRPGAVAELVSAAQSHPEIGMFAPRLEWPDGTPQHSCFPVRIPSHEFFDSAGTGAIEKVLGHKGYALPISDAPSYAEWVSFAAVLVRRNVFERIGMLDAGFFMYFEDMDFCYRARQAGFEILYWPESRIVHLRGGSSPVKSLTSQRSRPPSYWYASRTRYYAKHFGTIGLWRTNLYWHLGRLISGTREVLRLKKPHTNRSQWRDIWINAWHPMRQRSSH